MNPISEKDIFLDAIELPSSAARAEFLDRVCTANPQLRASVERLLAAHDFPASQLDHPIANMELDFTRLRNETINRKGATQTPKIGEWIGNFKLKELIGEGGFGLVYVAQQQRPVERLVALKIIKPGMDSEDILTRFDLERQAVAMMDHPNIAKIFDAGISDDQRPYFVMELVRGVPITEFCDAQRLTIHQRIKLFTAVCAAIQHAHQKGVIHRDIKPSNVLVTLHDDKPVVKVIDFGVAKAIGQRLTDKTIYTRFFSMIGTPIYMSPEQAQMSGLDVDTRSDIYSLGVLLYELLTGVTPFDRERLKSVGYDEMRKIIREEEPLKPSNQVTTVGDRGTLATISSARSIEPRRLQNSIRGDLDWIVLKSLEKDRNRRYGSASALADDLKRFLAEEPILARPPSRRYRFQKFFNRNRLAFMTAAIVLCALMIGSAVSLWQAADAIFERDQKEQALQAALQSEKKAQAATQEVEQFVENLKIANELLTSGQTYLSNRQWSAAYQEYSQAIELQPNYYLVWVQRAQLYARLYCWEEAASDFAKALELGAPIDEPSCWGAPQLFQLTNREQDYAEVIRSFNTKNFSDHPPTWNSIRNALLIPNSDVDFVELAAITETLLRDQKRPNQFPPGDRFRNPPPDREGRDRDRRSGRRPPAGPPTPGPPPGDRGGPPPGGRGGRGGRRGDEITPDAIKMYVAGWAQLRAGNYDQAMVRLDQTGPENRGWPGRKLVDFLRAIAQYQSGDTEEARRSLTAAQETMENWIAELDEDPSERMPIPWFDFAEAHLLMREAKLLIEFDAPLNAAAFEQRLQQVHDRNLDLLDFSGSLSEATGPSPN